MAQGLTLHAGAGIGFRGGVTYNPRNSNNVCSPLIRLYAGASGMAAYRFNAGRLPMTVRWQATLPVVGGFFLPDYDQSFYEMFSATIATPLISGSGTTVSIWTTPYASTSISARRRYASGYRNEFTTVWENNISQRRATHSLVVGIQWESLRIDTRRAMPERAKIISATY